MPGLAGIIARGQNEKALAAMLDSMAHEDFYTKSFHTQKGVAIGWVGQKGSFCDCLPIWNEKHNICLFLEGELYDWGSTSISLAAKGHKFSRGDASYLVHLYEERGLGFLSQLNGWFSGFLLDYRSHEIFLFNDRYGLGRLHYYEKSGSLVFASEAKAILRVLPATRQLDPDALGEWLACGATLSDKTLYRDIRLLAPGSVWTFTPGGKIKRRTYFSPAQWENQPRLKTEEYCENLVTTFQRILPRYFTGNRPIGMSLTGGLDGRMIMAWARQIPKELSCYTFGGMIRQSRDVQLARRIAQACGKTHQIIPVDQRFLDQFGELARETVYISDGQMDVSGAVELYINRLARGIAPVRLTGNFGSEILRGNIAFKPKTSYQGPYSPELQKYITEAVNTYATEKDGQNLSFIAFKQVPWFHHARTSIERSQLTLRSPFLDNDLVELVFRAPLLTDQAPSWALIQKGNPKLARIPTDRGLVYPPLPLITPLHFASEITRAKLEYAFDYGMPQWLARLTGMAKLGWGEKFLLGRQKFYHFRIWYRDQLAFFLKDILLDSRTRSRSCFNAQFLRDMVWAHTRGVGNYTREIHQVLTLELINRELFERAWPEDGKLVTC